MAELPELPERRRFVPEHRRDLWKMTAFALAVAAVTAVVTGVVVAHRTGVRNDAGRVESPAGTGNDVGRVDSPAASPATRQTTGTSTVGQAPPAAGPVAPEAGPRTPQADAPRHGTTPPASVTVACNKQAEAAAGGPKETNKPAGEALKGGAIGALGGAAVGALGGAIAGGGKGAGKGALIGGAVGAGGGSLYGIYESKKKDERYRTAYASCMRDRGYTS